MAASSVGVKTCTWISPSGSVTRILKILILPTSGYGPGHIAKVYFERSELYSSYVTWSARSFGAGSSSASTGRYSEGDGKANLGVLCISLQIEDLIYPLLRHVGR